MKYDSKRSPVRRSAGAVLGRAAVAGGVVAVGAAFGVLVSLPAAAPARAGDANYVRSSTHEAVSMVRLDEEIAILFNSPLLGATVGPDTILLRTGPTQGEQARGSYVVGSFLYDRGAQRRVVIRPEAIQEYYQLIKGFSREDATRLAQNTIRSMERSGSVKQLRKIDRELTQFFGASYGAGTRLDDETVFASYPPVLGAGDPIRRYRELIAGDDAKWQFYQNIYNNPTGDPADTEQAAQFFEDLRENPEYERFHHRLDPATGISDTQSVLRGRQYRKVLINRRAASRVMFVPEVPIRADLTDTGYKPGAAYQIVIPTAQPGVFNTVRTRSGRPLLQKDGRDYSTFFTTMPGSVGSVGLFLDNEARTGLATYQKPRIINVTPPNGETFVDRTTDWEDPDNAFDTPESARKVFTVRLRFAQPIDPRTVLPTNFTMRQTKINPGKPNETPVDKLVPVGAFLNQHRLGTVEVEITPVDNPDPNSQYEITVKGLVKSLGGVLLDTDYRVSFITGDSDPPLSDIRDTFLTNANMANPVDPDTLDQFTTAYWPAPTLYDPAPRRGLLLAKFMPFAGTGVGAPQDPTSPNSDIVTDLDLQAGQEIVFATENVDVASPDFGKQIEYHYESIQMLNGSTARAQGRFPLTLRSRTTILLKSANVLLNGSAGGRGTMNLDTVSGPPTGGLGGNPGPGGYRGGDGAGAPLADASGAVILDGQGQLQFDQTKFNGQDGYPGYILDNGTLHGGGSGGFSGDRESTVGDGDGNGTPGEPTDQPLEPLRFREAGGGGGHAEPGQDGDGARGSQEVHTALSGDTYPGGVGGNTYGDPAFADAPVNLAGVPTLTFGQGGAGGGGGGLEDDAPMGVVGPEDAGGGGGGGGGAIQLCARVSVVIDGATINCNGGAGGGTRNALDTSEGQGAPGGCGAGGAIWLQAFEGQVEIKNGAHVEAGGGDNATSTGEITTSATDTLANPAPIKGKGGKGGNGYVRLEDVDGVFQNLGNQVVGSISTATFAPQTDGGYPGRSDGIAVPMVVNTSVAYSRWFNSQLDTPTFSPVFDDPSTVGDDGIYGTFDDPLEGTMFRDFAQEAGGSVQIDVRTAPNDVSNTGHPNLFQATTWVPLDQVGNVADRRFLQFRVTFTLPLDFDNDIRYLPYVDYLQINIELQ